MSMFLKKIFQFRETYKFSKLCIPYTYTQFAYFYRKDLTMSEYSQKYMGKYLQLQNPKQVQSYIFFLTYTISEPTKLKECT